MSKNTPNGRMQYDVIAELVEKVKAKLPDNPLAQAVKREKLTQYQSDDLIEQQAARITALESKLAERDAELQGHERARDRHLADLRRHTDEATRMCRILAGAQALNAELREALDFTNKNGFCSADSCEKMEFALSRTVPQDALKRAISAEREACARLCESMPDGSHYGHCAFEIRNRAKELKGE